MKKLVPYLIASFLIGFGFASCTNDASQENMEDNISFVENAVAGFTNALARKDTSNLSTLISDSVSIMHPDKPRHFGIKRFKTFVRRNGWRQFQIVDSEIEMLGDFSVVKGNISYQVNQEKPKNPFNYRGEIILFVRKSNEGFWKIEQFIYSSWRQSNPKPKPQEKAN